VLVCRAHIEEMLIHQRPHMIVDDVPGKSRCRVCRCSRAHERRHAGAERHRERHHRGPRQEDAVCAAAAESCGCEAIVIRDPDGYPNCPVPVIDSAAALAWLAQRAG
jgi:hypothetical protein